MLRLLIKICSVITAALAGNWLGGQIRTLWTGQEVQSIRFHYTNQEGKNVSNIPVATKFYPAAIGAGIGKPRWFFAFLAGVLAGALIDDTYERLFLETMGQLSTPAGIIKEPHPAQGNSP
ncbi:MAG: hypothetical protein R6U57_08745 [Anaerolineales bacterium]